MAIVVEDGSIVAGANSYASVSDLEEYASARGITLGNTSEENEVLLIKAMDWMEAKYGQRWQGERVNLDQPLAWPRTGVWVDNIHQDIDQIPRNLFYGQLAAAVEANSQDLQENRGPAVKRRKVGELEVEYTNEGKRLDVSAFSKPEALLNPLVRHGGLSLAVRA